MAWYRRKIVVADDTVTNAVNLTNRQSLVPNLLVTILFFLWGFAYGLLDVLNSHFQTSLHISSTMSAGLSSAYFGAYFVCPPTISGWILRRFGFRVTFMTGEFRGFFSLHFLVTLLQTWVGEFGREYACEKKGIGR